jgi:small-conductance mechanosensitive channel
MEEFINKLHIGNLATPEVALRVGAALAFLLVGLVLARLAAVGVSRMMKRRATAQDTMVVRRIVYYSILFIVVASTLHELGLRIGVVLGAAGVLTVAVGFAAQTSVSNLISGMFVIAERSFVVGDVIRISDITGEVLSIDLLSVKLRTFDNLYVRVPNENVIKSTVTNLTHFPIRRLDILMGVAYKEDLRRVRDILMDVAERNPICLTEPTPLFIFQKFGDSALEFQFSVWSKRENYLELINSVNMEIKDALDAAGIEIPFPHRTLYAGSETAPIPVRVTE